MVINNKGYGIIGKNYRIINKNYERKRKAEEKL